jgi:hypothetical protein
MSDLSPWPIEDTDEDPGVHKGGSCVPQKPGGLSLVIVEMIDAGSTWNALGKLCYKYSTNHTSSNEIVFPTMYGIKTPTTRVTLKMTITSAA